MPYNCNDIDRILKSDVDSPVDSPAFLSHIDSCARCRELADFGKSLANAFDNALPSPAPDDFAQRVVLAIENSPRASSFSKIAITAGYIIALITLAITSILAYQGRESIIDAFSFIKSIPPDSILSSGYLNSLVETTVDLIKALAGSQIFVAGLMALAAMLWIYSISQIREITK